MADDRPKPFAVNAVHMVRTIEQINVQMSQMADQKASILMGATFVVFTITIAQARGGEVQLSLLLLAGFSFLSAMLAVFAVLPKVGGGKGAASANPNLLFFGNFAALPEREFADRVIETLRDEEAMYRAMLRDIHQNGQVLAGKKYRWLGHAYRIFLAGLTLAFVAFLVEQVAR